MTTTTTRRRPTARKTRETEAGTEAAVETAVAVEPAPVAAPAEPAAKPARKRASRAKTPRVATDVSGETLAVEAADAVDVSDTAVGVVLSDAVVAADADDAADAAELGHAAVAAEVTDAAAAAADAIFADILAEDAAEGMAEVVEAPAPAPAPKKRPARKRAAIAEVVAGLIADVAAEAAAPVVATPVANRAQEVDTPVVADEAAAEAAVEAPSEVAASVDGEADMAPARGRRKPKAKPEPVVEEVPAAPPRYTLGAREDDGVFGDYELRDGETGGTFRLRLLGRQTWRCDCAGYLAQGDCEHGGHLLAMVDAAQHEALDAGWPAREAEVWLVPGVERRVQWVCGRDVPERLREQPGLDEQLRRGAEGAHAWLQQVLADARALGVVLRVDAPVWPQLCWGRDAQARVERLEALMADGAAMRALLRDELPVHAWEAALFAVCAGRALIADDLGLGQRGAAIAAIRLWGELFGVKPAVVIAPEAAQAAWRRDLRRWLGEDASSVTVAVTPPAKPVAALLVVDGIESMDAEALAALRATSAAQLLLIAHQEPLGDARLPEWIDWLDEARRGPLAALQALPADAGKKQKREALEAVVLSRRKRELVDSLPEALLSPLWLEAAGASLPSAPLKQIRQLIERWTALRFLGSAEQQQLLEALALLPPASRQALAAKAEAVLALRREWVQGAVPAATRLLVCARSETLLESLSMSPQLRRLPPQRLRAGDSVAAREAALAAWRSAEAGVLLASDDALASLDVGALPDDRVAIVHADLPWQVEAMDQRLWAAVGEEARGVPAALLLIEDSLDAAVLRAQREGVAFPGWLDAAPVWLDAEQLGELMAVLPKVIEGL